MILNDKKLDIVKLWYSGKYDKHQISKIVGYSQTHTKRIISRLPERKFNNEWEFKEDRIFMHLTGNKVCVIDKEDFEKVSIYKWCSNGLKRTYAFNNGIGMMHRLIMGLNDSSLFIDHINYNTLDNRKENLRIVTQKENVHHMQPRPGSSKFKGVSVFAESNKFVANITNNYKQIYLGLFDSEEEAAKAYDKKAKELFGVYAYLNFN